MFLLHLLECPNRNRGSAGTLKEVQPDRSSQPHRLFIMEVTMAVQSVVSSRVTRICQELTELYPVYLAARKVINRCRQNHWRVPTDKEETLERYHRLEDELAKARMEKRVSTDGCAVAFLGPERLDPRPDHRD